MGIFTKDKPKEMVYELDIAQIHKNPNQPRTTFSKEELNSLAQSIAENGLLQPIAVRKVPDGYELISGERRLIASQMAGKKTIRAVLCEVTDEQSAILAIIENIQRQQLTCFEEASAIQKLMEQYGTTQEEIARRLGKAQSTIANKLRLLRIPAQARRLMTDAHLTERHARAMLKLLNTPVFDQALAHIIEENLNVEAAEEYIDSLLCPAAKPQQRPTSNKLVIIKDIRPFVNSLNKVVRFMKHSGLAAMATMKDDDFYYEYIVRIPKTEGEKKRNLA